ncbi:MAG: chromosomal replication initiator protein DnaA, partial [Bacteroidia bacterium]|nr:chromosomal replication initiator protein DnaA [Bacteroidia bacterium]
MIRDNVSPQIYKTWFAPIKPLRLEGSVLTIRVPSQFFYEWLEENYVALLRRTVRHNLGPDARLMYDVVIAQTENANNPQTVHMPTLNTEMGRTTQQLMSMPLNKTIPNPNVIPGLKKVTLDPQLNPLYTFDTLIEGDCNRVARNAAMAIARNPGETAYNPFFVFGGVGLGKTHLVHAIGNQVRFYYSGKIVLYVQTERFIQQFVEASKSNNAHDFVANYQAVDVLIMDDIQFMAGKDKTQDVFFHLFNHLYQNRKQIIVTADALPRELSQFEERLKSRFGGGLLVDLKAPGEETRAAILRSKIRNEGIDLPDNVVEYIARRINTNVRELEGALISLIAQSSFNGREINLELAEQVVKSFTQSSTKELTIEQIQKIVCDYFGLGVDKMKDP